MNNRQQFNYSSLRNLRGELALRPILPILLRNNSRQIETTGLLDTGADVNALPYDIGLELGATWEHQRELFHLSGNLAKHEARGIVLSAQIPGYALVRLAFAWTTSVDIPVILGQVNFFMSYDVCFYRARNLIEVFPSTNDYSQTN